MKTSTAAASLALAAALSLPCAGETPNPSGRTMAEVLAQLETFASGARTGEKVPGMAYAVVKDGEVVFAKGYGKRAVTDAADNVTTGTLFQLCSTTKAFTAALVAMEVDAGKLSWDDRVVDHLPDFKLHDPWVTAEFRVCDLLSQRSGLPAYSLDLMPYLGYSRREIEKALAHVEPAYGFRNGFGYVNNLWLVAARLVEKLEGMSWEEAIEARVFQPLGMRESTVDPALAMLVADRATGHYVQAGGVVTPIPDGWPLADTIETIGPAGSIRSTILDFARWAAFQLAHGRAGNANLVSTASVDAMHAPRTYIVPEALRGLGGAPKSIAYALGWLNEEFPAGTIVWHNGGSVGQHSIIVLYEQANVALVVLTNSAGNQVPERMRLELLDLLQVPPGGAATPREGAVPRVARAAKVAAVALDRVSRAATAPEPLAPVPPLPLERYAGAYENPAYGRFVVSLRGGALVLSAGPRPFEGALVPWSGNTFVWKAPLGLPPEDTFVTFTVPPGQSAARFVAAACHDVRGGAFVRTQ